MTLSLTLLQVIQTKRNPATHLTSLYMNLVVSKMADEQQQQQEEQQFCCSVCMDLPKEPVTINCGRYYCRSCIEGWWDQEKGECSCPQCRETFSQRPVLRRNNMLAEVISTNRRGVFTCSYRCLTDFSKTPFLPVFVLCFS